MWKREQTIFWSVWELPHVHQNPSLGEAGALYFSSLSVTPSRGVLGPWKQIVQNYQKTVTKMDLVLTSDWHEQLVTFLSFYP